LAREPGARRSLVRSSAIGYECGEQGLSTERATQPSPGEAINGTCSGTAAVPGGGFALNVGGKSIGNSVSGAIVGGTGKYTGATGTFSSKSSGGENSPSTLTLNYTLP
jgi:hypothetical protein